MSALSGSIDDVCVFLIMGEDLPSENAVKNERHSINSGVSVQEKKEILIRLPPAVMVYSVK